MLDDEPAQAGRLGEIERALQRSRGVVGLGERVERQRVEQPRLGADRHRRAVAGAVAVAEVWSEEVARRARVALQQAQPGQGVGDGDRRRGLALGALEQRAPQRALADGGAQQRLPGQELVLERGEQRPVADLVARDLQDAERGLGLPGVAQEQRAIEGVHRAQRALARLVQRLGGAGHEVLGLLALAPLDGDGRLHAVGGTRRLRPSPPAAHRELDGLVGVAQRALELAAERARHREVGRGGEGGPVVAPVEGVGVGPLEMRGRRVEVAGPELDDAELSEDEGPHAAAQVAALEDGGLVAQLAGGPERGLRIAAQAALVQAHRGSAGGERGPALRRYESLAFLGAAQVGLGAGVVAAREQRTAEGEGELGRGLDEPARHRLEDGAQRAHLAVDHHGEPARRGEVGREIPGAARGRMAQGGGVVAVRGEPRRGPPVQLRDLVGELRAQLGAQELGEQRVVAMPGAALVERRREHAAVLQSRQHRVAVRRPGERVGELGAQRLDDRGAQQEVAQLRRLAGQHLADQVVADRRVGAREVLDEGARVGMVLQRHGREAQRRRPPLGAPPERREVLGRQHDAQRAEQRAGLVEREVQVGRADLGQAAVEAQTAESDRRVRPRDDDEPQGRRREAHEPFEILVDGVDDLVEVVEHEHDRLLGALRARRRARAPPGPCSSAREGSPPAPRPRRRPSPGRAPPGPRARSGGDRRHRCRATARRPVPADGPRRSTSSAARSCRHRPERRPA